MRLHVASPRRAFVLLALLCAAGIPLCWMLGVHETPTRAAMIALAIEAALLLTLATTWRPTPGPRRRALHCVLLVVMGLLAAAPGWYFGPNGGFEGLIGLLLVVAGLLSGGIPGRLPALAGWLSFISLAVGQGLAGFLVFGGYLPDLSLSPMIAEGHPTSHHYSGLVAVQVIFLFAFLLGRAFQARYADLVQRVDQAVHQSARHEALLDEARNEYRRALDAGRRGVHSGRTVGDYRLGALLGDKDVYEAVHVQDGLRVAVRLRGDSQLVERVPLDTESASYTNPAPPAPAEGDSLARHAPLPPAEVHAMLESIGAALQAMHARGQVHLEVRPSTVVRAGEGWRLLDVGEVATRPPGPDALRCMAPERMTGAFADVRADVYGLATVVYTALTGRQPHDDADPARLPAGERPLPPDVGPEGCDLELVLRRGLAANPGDRPATVRELVSSVVAAMENRLDESIRLRARSLPGWRAPAPRATPARITTPPPAPAEAPQEVWQHAYQSKMRGFYLGITALCLAGAAYFAWVILDPLALAVGLASIALALAAAWLHHFLTRRHPDTGVYWPWAIVGVASAGPAYAIGFHMGFSLVVAILLFAGGLFRARTQRRGSSTDRGLVLAAVVVSHTVFFLLVAFGVVPDRGNFPVRLPHLSVGEIVVLHFLLQGIYVAAFFTGRAVDRRYEALLREAEAATREAAQKQALLADARAELDGVLARDRRGIFSGLRLGSHQLGPLLGRGGMGEVYEATAADGTRVALKLIRGDRVADPRNLKLFLSEAESLSRVRSPHVARVYAIGGLSDELPYIAMELVDGRTLAELLRGRDRLDLAEALTLVRDMGRGLGDVHAAGVLHLDLKPQNVILAAADRRWKLVDFGVARLAAAASDEQRWIMGTPAYMSPEQALGEAVDARADLYSVAAILYRALTGRPPFIGKHPSDIARAARSSSPPEPRVGDDLSLALRIGLAAAPADRFASAAEMSAAFEAAFAGRLSEPLRRHGRDLLRKAPWR